MDEKELDQIYGELELESSVIKKENDRKLKSFTDNIISVGDKLVDEIERKNIEKENQRFQMITYIIKKTKSKLISQSKLEELSYDEVLRYYQKAKEYKPWYVEMFQFLIGN